jgi:hypothetical protein
MSPFRFNPATPGETLLHLLHDRILTSDGSQASDGSIFSGTLGLRGQAIHSYAVCVSALNLTARLIKKAQRVLDMDDASLHHGEFLRYMQQTLGLVKHDGDLLDEVARQSLYAAKMSKRDITKATKRKVRQDRLEVECYLCGNMCIHKSTDAMAAIYYEHVWPASYGGDSIDGNLLPACYGCNEAKGDMILWHTGAIFSFVLRPAPSDDERTRITRREKVARRIQDIVASANEAGCTLKEAAISIGPAKFERLAAIDSEDAVDYFNLHFA